MLAGRLAMTDAEPRWTPDRLALVLSASGLGHWSWEADTDVVTLSERAAELFGLPRGTRPTWAEVRDLLHPEDRERARAAVEHALATRTDYRIEYRVLEGDRERFVFASGRGEYGPDGRVERMFGLVQDTTKDRLLVRVDDALRPLARPEEITFTAARILGQHLRVNRCAYAFVAPDEDTFTLTGDYNDGVESIVGRYRFRQFGDACLRLMRAGEPYVVEDCERDDRVDDVTAYRRTAIRAVVCVPIMKASRFVAAMAVHTKAPRRWESTEIELVQQVASRCWESIERARVEAERLVLLEEAEAANRAKDEFLAMLGHELRNPLAPIVTALQLMKLRGETSLERERTVIERQVGHLTRLVDDLLDVSRIARGKVELKVRVIELRAVVMAGVEVASPVLEARKHVLTVEVAPAGLSVHGDASRLVQVVGNLLTNAAKYTPPGGSIHVSASREGDEVVLRVRDDGVGIPRDVLPHVFELFVQAPQTMERAQGGLGLGLTIARSLIERHGGRIEAFSDGPGRGSEIVVSLPYAANDADADAVSAPSRPAVNVKPLHVLVVDDNVDAATTLADALRYRRCEVALAHDGVAALRQIASRPFHLALVDIGLPVMDGYEVAARVRERQDRVVLVAITGYGQEKDRRRALDAGFSEHLVKPVDLAALDPILDALR